MWTGNDIKPALKALWHNVLDLRWCLWSNGPLRFDTCNSIVNCLIVLARVEIVAKKRFHCLCFPSRPYLDEAGRARMLFLSDTLLHIRSSTRSRPRSFDAGPNSGVERVAHGHLWQLQRKPFSRVFTHQNFPSPSPSTSRLQVDVFAAGFHAYTTSSPVSPETSQSPAAFIAAASAKPAQVFVKFKAMSLLFEPWSPK